MTDYRLDEWRVRRVWRSEELAMPGWLLASYLSEYNAVGLLT